MMSELVRRQGTDWKGYGKCYTCGNVIHWKEANAGHRYHGKLDFDLRNLKRQCVHCNKYQHGNLGAYEMKLQEEYGMEWCKQLEKDAWEKGNKYSMDELREIEIILKNELEKL